MYTIKGSNPPLFFIYLLIFAVKRRFVGSEWFICIESVRVYVFSVIYHVMCNAIYFCIKLLKARTSFI